MRAWILACLLVAGSVHAAVSPPFIANGESEPIVRVDLRQDSAATSPAEPLTGLTHDSTGLAVSCIASPQSTWTDYTVAGTDQIETIATIGTYAAPTASNVRFAEIESEGVYELQFETSLFSVTDSDNVTCKISGATDLATRTFTMYQGLAETDSNGRFASKVEEWNGVALSTTNPLPNAAPAANGGLPTVDASNRIVGIQGTVNTFDGLNDPTATENADAVRDADNSSPAAGSLGEVLNNRASQASVDGLNSGLEQTQLRDAQAINCEVNTPNFAGSTTTFACILTDRDDMAVTAASNDYEQRRILVRSGAEAGNERNIVDSTWDAGNSELQIQIDRALGTTLADGVDVLID